ncbi:MAG: cupredoxin domain-containing protein [Actinomycetota bacterium]|nr:cupredoxin domain-containing protein [Actinomycetota bacterium]
MKALATVMSGCAIVVMAGCSEDEEAPGRSVTVRPDETVNVVAEEYRFDPDRIVVKGAGADVRLRVALDNRGSLAHNLRVRAGEREIAGLRSFPPGEKRPLSAALERGEYDFVCTVADHEELGMVGKLEVR